MPDWAIWFIVGAALMAGELLVTAAVLGPIGLAAFGAGIVAALGASSEVQIVTFIVLTVLSLVFARPIAKRHLMRAAAGVPHQRAGAGRARRRWCCSRWTATAVRSRSGARCGARAP